MTISKATVLQVLNSLPDEFKTEELVERLLFAAKLEKGWRDIEEGKVISLNKAKSKFSDEYNSEFVEKIKQGDADLATGKGTIVNINNLWK